LGDRQERGYLGHCPIEVLWCGSLELLVGSCLFGVGSCLFELLVWSRELLLLVWPTLAGGFFPLPLTL
jgi:hypothetical protein